MAGYLLAAKMPVFLGLPLGFLFFLARDEQSWGSMVVVGGGTAAGSGELGTDVEEVGEVFGLVVGLPSDLGDHGEVA